MQRTSPKQVTIGRSRDCDLVLDHASVSRHHAELSLSEEGYLLIRDSDSSNGTWIGRGEHWARLNRAYLGSRDRVRFGDQDVDLDRLIEALGGHERIRLREDPLLPGHISAGQVRTREVLENPRRNPVTGQIEENN